MLKWIISLFRKPAAPKRTRGDAFVELGEALSRIGELGDETARKANKERRRFQ